MVIISVHCRAEERTNLEELLLKITLLTHHLSAKPYAPSDSTLMVKTVEKAWTELGQAERTYELEIRAQYHRSVRLHSYTVL